MTALCDLIFEDPAYLLTLERLSPLHFPIQILQLDVREAEDGSDAVLYFSWEFLSLNEASQRYAK